MSYKSLTVAVLTLACLLPVAAQAQTKPATPATPAVKASTTTTSKGEAVPVDIESDSMEILEENKRVLFKGNVDTVKGDQRMHADEMTVYYEEIKQPDGSAKTDVTKIDSKGNVTITTKSQVLTGDWAKMNVISDTLEMGGNVKVVQGKTELSGNHLDADLKTNRTVVTGGRTKAKFIPK